MLCLTSLEEEQPGAGDRFDASAMGYRHCNGVG